MKAPFFERLVFSKRKRLQRLKQEVINYLASIPESEINREAKEVLNYLTTHDISVFPYPFAEQYVPSDIVIEYDAATKLFYTIWDGEKLYYKNGTRKKKAQKYFNSLRLEQDIRSPHRYLTDQFNVSENDVVADIGGAEGNFSLSVIIKAKHIYLFEPEKDWVKALEATFAPWQDKVTIVRKYVSDKTTDTSVSLDDFFSDNQSVHFLKADVEGYEHQLLAGAKKLITSQPNIKLAICTYHRQDDAGEIEAVLKSFGLKTEFTPGYMLYHYGRENIVKPPYLRKAVVRAFKSN